MWCISPKGSRCTGPSPRVRSADPASAGDQAQPAKMAVPANKIRGGRRMTLLFCHRKMRSRLPLWTGLFAALFLAQLGWWGFVIWRAADELRDAQYAELQNTLLAAESRLPEGGSLDSREAAWQRLAAEYPQLAFNREAGLQISADALRAIESRRAGTRVMVLSESSLFAVLALLGFGLLIRTWKRERYLLLQQSNFLHAVTHELRSPLQSLRLAVETMRRRPERLERYSEHMLADLDRLGALVDNLLTTGRLEAEAFRAKIELGDLVTALHAELDRIERAHQLQAGRVQREFPNTLTARFDPSTLEPIVRNLVENALKYGGDAPIRVQLEQDGSEAVLAVEDQGRGLEASEIPHVFERFWRAGDEQVRTAPGTGLGLFLVQELARAQGARTRVSSPGRGHGARFEVRWGMS
ncbi:MAG: hypothetical protein CMJ94_09235 [Planctomycetes bacterium]|nr:hypothetical protein [Planctomycetota bacterium]